MQADSVEAVNAMMKDVKSWPQEEQQRFATLSMVVMQKIIADQQAKGGEMNTDEMDAEIKRIMHGKTLDELEAYVNTHIAGGQ